MAIVGQEYCDPEERVLTVRKTSHFSPGDGFAAYDHRTGGLTFRVDTYGRGQGGGAASAGDLALLGPAGEPILTVRRRRPSLHQRWEGFLGARADGEKPLFSARRSSFLGGSAAGAVIELLSPVPSSAAPVLLRVDGSFPRRCCRVVAPRGEGEKDAVVAEIRRKVDEAARVVMGMDVFVLRVSAGFDAAFAMGIVLVLDQIAGDDAGVDTGADIIDAKI
ncbi:protein LURP-one-related 5-like [Phragmites australis]|uniref:protein LURP-one-related 5-like n=1 Tax=Phragmites australis TaxID=29695 RepID=UPI002D76AA1B|nr:protein LURP-one-related 5-like [Phragmites australis]